jgi:hypothetical protein
MTHGMHKALCVKGGVSQIAKEVRLEAKKARVQIGQSTALTDFVSFPGFEVSLFSHNSWI